MKKILIATGIILAINWGLNNAMAQSRVVVKKEVVYEEYHGDGYDHHHHGHGHGHQHHEKVVYGSCGNGCCGTREVVYYEEEPRVHVKTRYIYYDDYDMYYDHQRQVYLYINNGSWTVSANIPYHLRRVDISQVRSYNVNYTGSDPYRYQQQHRRESREYNQVRYVNNSSNDRGSYRSSSSRGR